MFQFSDSQCLHELIPSLSPSKPNPSSYFFPFSPTTFHDDGFHGLLTSHILPAPDALLPNPTPTKQLPSTDPPPRRSTGRKRALRKDRHSKIFTAQGPRDRRMRLSLDVARKFFDLQDMLGFDKASKTVQWLLTMSDLAIKDLIPTSRPKDGAFSESSTLDCENICKGKSSVAVSKSNTLKAKKMIRKTVLHPGLARESRALARERARERTREKKRTKCGWLEDNDEPNTPASSSIPIQFINDQSGSHDLKSSLKLVAEVEEKHGPSREQCKRTTTLDEGVSYDFPAGGGVSLNHNILDYNQNFISNHDMISFFQEQCEMNLEGDIEERGQTDVQFQAREPWEVFNNNPIL